MTVNQREWESEVQHLIQVYGKIQKELDEKKSLLRGVRQSIVAVRESVWEDLPHVWEYGDLDAAVEIKQYYDEMARQRISHEVSYQLVKKLEKMEASPFFARVDFTEEDYPDTERIYIGIASFFDEETRDILIYDWRAPVSSIFYDFELGPAEYRCQEGTIRGQMTLKRQFKISRDCIDYTFDSSVKIDDEVLQEILSKSADEKMKTIVTTIQKEQNRIIRNEDSDMLIVQGAAGSGKTSIALHRVAYFLYKYREQKITARNIMIFSPNQLFNDYISNVLPELGEENMRQTTFLEYARKRLGPSCRIEDMNEQMEYLLTQKGMPGYDARVIGISYKTSDAYFKILNSYMEDIESRGFHFRDVAFRGRMIAAGEEIQRLFGQEFRDMPLIRRLARIKQRILYQMRPAWRERFVEIKKEVAQNPEYKLRLKGISRLMLYKEFKVLRQQVDAMLHFDAFEAYTRLLEDEELFHSLAVRAGVQMPEEYAGLGGESLKMLRKGILPYEDLPPYLYLKGEWEGAATLPDILHVVIDEAQDYSPIQYAIFKQLFPYGRMTVLGDLNQAIHPYMKTNRYEIITDVMKPASPILLRLTRSYRSTREIVDFSKAVLGEGEEIEAIDRRGEKPQMYRMSGGDPAYSQMLEDLRRLREEGSKSIGVICKTAGQSQELFQRLRDDMEIRLITRDDVEFSTGAVVIPSYLAKGLEFDAVIVYDASAENYGRESERKLLYTACTRALHKLRLYCQREVSPFIKDIPKSLYEVKQ